MLDITLLRLRGALISCMGLQRAAELRIGPAWHKCAAGAFDWVATAARQPVARSRRPSRCSAARRRRPFHMAQQVTTPHALQLRSARRTARRWSVAAATWRQFRPRHIARELPRAGNAMRRPLRRAARLRRGDPTASSAGATITRQSAYTVQVVMFELARACLVSESLAFLCQCNLATHTRRTSRHAPQPSRQYQSHHAGMGFTSLYGILDRRFIAVYSPHLNPRRRARDFKRRHSTLLRP